MLSSSLYEEAYLYQPGKIPVILTIPHGISLDQSHAAHLAERKSGRVIEELYLLDFVEILTNCLRKTWEQPHTFTALIHRSRIDFARGKECWRGECAYDDPRAEPYYDAFEDRLKLLCADVTRQHNSALLLDLHGCLSNDFDAYLGTLNGHTTKSFGGQLFARDSIQTALSQRQWRIAPLPGEREIRFSGRADSIIARYNLSTHPGLHASIQIELSGDIRSHRSERQRFAVDLAAAIKTTLQQSSKSHTPME